MDCDVCYRQFNTAGRVPRVLQCGHTFCCSCLSTVESDGVILCMQCKRIDYRRVADVPQNYSLMEAVQVEATAQVRKLEPSTSSSNLPQRHRLWLDERLLQLSSVELGKGRTGKVIQGVLQSCCTDS
jgi:hypothetical protein